MKVLLVRPAPEAETIGLQHVMLVEPLELEVLAALCHPKAEPVVVDLSLERQGVEHFIARERPDVFGITGYITNVATMLAACRLAKRRDPRTVTIVGGVHCEVCPDDLDDPAVDFRVVRNAITGFGALLEHLRGEGPVPAGVLRPGERVLPEALPPFDFAWVRPDRTSTARYRERYFYIFHDKVALLKTAFGCPYRCSFCFCRVITAGHYHERPLDDVLDELQSLREREIYIVDDDFLVSTERVRAFIAGLRARRIDKHYLLYGRADFIAKHPEVMREFQGVGLRTVIVGFESFSDSELAGYRKNVSAATNEEAMRVMNGLGLECFATLILSPHWDRSDFDALVTKLKELRVRFVNLQPLTPLPGTPFTVPAGDLLIDRADFAKWDLAHVAVRPTKLTVSQYYREIIRAYLHTLYRPSYLLGYLRHPPKMLWKMVAGTFAVRQQYARKWEEAERAEKRR